MPNIKSAIKRVDVAKTKTLENSIIKTGVKTSIKKFEESVKTQDTAKMQDALVNATKTIDKACAKGVLKKNTASNKKSKLATMLNKAAAK